MIKITSSVELGLMKYYDGPTEHVSGSWIEEKASAIILSVSWIDEKIIVACTGLEFGKMRFGRHTLF